MIRSAWIASCVLVCGALTVNAEPPDGPLKITHAEPLLIDLIRDLGARKGEREWNVAFGLTDQARFDRYEALVEYEWAPVNRLGLEVEVPFTFYPPVSDGPTPSNRIEGLTRSSWRPGACRSGGTLSSTPVRRSSSRSRAGSASGRTT